MANRRFIDFPIASTVGENDIVLIWQSGANKQTTKATLLSGVAKQLNDLTDVTITSLANGQILQYDSVTGQWINVDRTDIDLSELGDVSIISPANGQVLVYNSATAKWENSSGGYVPYVGAVTTVDLGLQGLEAGFIRLDTSITSPPTGQGTMYWDQDEETVAIILNGSTTKVGEDIFFQVKNQSGSTIPKGTAVRFDGVIGASGRVKIVPFQANGSNPSIYFLGVTYEAIANGADGKALFNGKIRGVNTTAYAVGDILYASPTVAGGFTTTKPVAPNNIISVAAVLSSGVNGILLVRPTIGSNINNDEGVKITTPTTGDLLQLQASGLWENKTKAQILNGTPLQFVKGDGSLDSTAYQPLLTNPITGTGANGQVAFWNGTNTQTGDNGLFWDNVNKRLRINQTIDSSFNLDVNGTARVQGDLTVGLTGQNGKINFPNTTGNFAVSLGTSFTGNSVSLSLGTRSITINGAGNASINCNTSIFGVNGNAALIVSQGNAAWLTLADFRLGATSIFRFFTNGNLSIGTTTNEASSILTLESATRGFLPPRMTSTQRDAIASPATGLQLYNTTSNTPDFYNGTSWVSLQTHDAVTLGTANGLSLSGQVLSLGLASGSTNGALSSTDWTTFNNKQPALNGTGFVKISGTTISYDNSTYYLASNPNGYTSNLGTVTSVTASSPLSSSGGTTPNITIQQASGSQSGFLSSTDWATFNNKIGGSGTTNYIAKFTAGGTVGNSAAYESGGNVGIGTDSPTRTLHVLGQTGIGTVLKLEGASGVTTYLQLSYNGATNAQSGYIGYDTSSDMSLFTNDTERLRITSSGNLLINTTNDTGAYKLDVNGTGRFTGNLTALAFFTSSDKRKKDIISQDGDLATYRFKGDDQIHYGYIAQNMQGLYPNQVSTDNDGMLSLNYIEILVKKVHDLETKLKKHGLD